MKNTLFVSIVLLLTCILSPAATADDTSVFVGEWTINTAKTLEAGKKSPKYNPDDQAIVEKVVNRMAKVLKLKVTPQEMIYLQKGKEIKFPYTATQSTKTKMVAQASIQDKQVTITFTLIDGKWMNMKSTGTDDMDYYIWQRVEKNKAKQDASENEEASS